MKRWDLDAEMLGLADRQHGLVALEQLRPRSTSDEAVAHRLASPYWEPVTERVLRAAGSPATPEQAWLAAVLDAGTGAVLSHHSAAALHGLPGFDGRRVQVTRPRVRSRRPSTLASVHEPLRLPDHHRTVVRGVPVTTVARTLFDLCGSAHPRRAERAVDNALARRLVSVGRLEEVVADLAGRGVPGSRLARRLLAARDQEYVAAESGLEDEGLAWLAAAGFPPIDRQVWFGGDDGLIGRADGRFRDLPVLVEIDSDLHHTSVADRAADERRDARSRAAGFVVVRLREREVTERDARALERVAAARAEARSRLQEPAA